MSNIRLFYSESLSINLCGKLNKEQSRYLISVMRLKINQDFSLFNKSGEWNSKIISINKGIIDDGIILESLISFKRAGANAIVTYFADEVAKKLK